MEIFVYPAKQWYDVSHRRLPTRILNAQVLNIGFLSRWHNLNIVHKSSKYEYAIVAKMYFLVAWVITEQSGDGTYGCSPVAKGWCRVMCDDT